MSTTDNTNSSLQEVQQLRDQVESLSLAAEAVSLKMQLRHADLKERTIEESYCDSSTWGSVINPLEFLNVDREFFGGPSFSKQDRADGKRDGDFAPHFTNEQQLSSIRGAGCFIAETDPAGINIVQTLINYAVGVGMTHTVTPKSEVGDNAKQIVAQCQVVVDEFLERTNWTGHLDAELFARTRKTGERFIHLVGLGGGYVDVEVCEPSWITEPQSCRQIEDHFGLPVGLNWKYGIATEQHRPSNVVGYFCNRYGYANDWDFIPDDDMLHIKVNVERGVKRGLSDFYGGGEEWLSDSKKALRNIVKGAGIQAAVAMVRKHAKNGNISSVREGMESRVVFPSQQSATNHGPAELWRAGMILDERNFDTAFGAMGTPVGPQLISVIDAGLRFAGRRWGMPEDIISGNASANNYASILEAHTPFTIQMKRVQFQEATADKRLLWKVLDAACDAGRIACSKSELRKAVDIDVKPPDIETRDQEQDHTIRMQEHEAGLLSLKTWAEQEGLDYEKEQANIAKEPKKPVTQPLDANGGKVPSIPSIPVIENNDSQISEPERIQLARDLLFANYP